MTPEEKVQYARELIAEAFAQGSRRDQQKFALRAIEVIRAFQLDIVAPSESHSASACRQSIPIL